MKLKLELFRYGSLVFGKVLEQDESLRCSSGSSAIDIGTGDFSISSDNGPELRNTVLYIRGRNTSLDHRAFFKDYSSIDKAKEAVETIKYFVDKLNSDSPKGDISSIERIL